MKEKTNTTPEASEQVIDSGIHMEVGRDLKNSVLIVSIVANLAILIGWILLQMTARYDASLASFILGR